MMNEKFQKGVLKVLFFAALVAPLVTNRRLFFPYSTASGLYFRLVVEVLFILWLVFILARPKYRPKFNFLSLSLGLYAVALILATVFSTDPYLSFWGDAERMMGLFGMLHFFVLFLVGSSLFRKKEELLMLLNVFVIVNFLVAMHGIFQRLGLTTINPGADRIIATVGNSGTLAGYLIFGLFLSLFLIFKNKELGWKIFFSFAILAQVIALVLTGTRGAFLGVAFGGLVTFIFFIKNLKHNKKIKKWSLGVLTMFILFYGFLFFSKDNDWVKNNHYLNRLTNFSLQDTTAQTRLMTWQWGLEGFKEKPVLGYGFERFAIPFNKHFEAKYYSLSNREYFDRAHNIFVELLTTTGLVGFIAYIILLSAIFICIFRVLKEKKDYIYFSIFTGLILAYLVQNLLIFDVLPPMLGFMVSLIVIANYGKEIKEKEKQGFGKWVIVPVFVILAGIFGYYFDTLYARPYVALKDQVLAQVLIYDNYEQGMAYAKRSVTHNTYLDMDIRSASANTIYNYYVTTGAIRDEQKEDIEKAIEMYKENLAYAPNDAYYNYKTGEILNFRFAIDLDEKYIKEAKEYIDKAIEMSPNRARMYYVLTENLLMSGDLDEAIQVAEQALALNENFGESQWELTKAYFIVQRYDEAKESLIKTINLGHKVSDENMEMFRVLFDVHVSDENAIKFFELVIKNGTDNYLYYSTLATKYYQKGEYDKAIEMAKESARLKPDTKEKVEKFIKEAENKKKEINE